MSARLTNELRDRIVARLVKNATEKTMLELEEREGTLAKLCYDTIIPEKDRKIIEKHPHLFSTMSHVNVYVGDLKRTLRFPKSVHIPKPIAEKFGFFRIEGDSPIYKELYDFVADYREADVKLRTLEATATATLSKFSTLKKAREAWPDLMTVAKDLLEEPDTTTTAVAFPLEDLNAKFGLPVEEKA
jgi:hypothetical protein